MAVKDTRTYDVERHLYRIPPLYEVTLDTLDQLERDSISVSEDFSFALFCLAAALSFSITILTVDIPAGKMYDSFFVITVLGYVGLAFFGVRWITQRKSLRKTIARIKESSGPLGEESQQINAEELANLPAEEKDN